MPMECFSLCGHNPLDLDSEAARTLCVQALSSADFHHRMFGTCHTVKVLLDSAIYGMPLSENILLEPFANVKLYKLTFSGISYILGG